jgi:hypothetical protein
LFATQAPEGQPRQSGRAGVRAGPIAGDRFDPQAPRRPRPPSWYRDRPPKSRRSWLFPLLVAAAIAAVPVLVFLIVWIIFALR